MTKSFALLSILFATICASKLHLRGSVFSSETLSPTHDSFLNLYTSSQPWITLKRDDYGFPVTLNLMNDTTNNSTATAVSVYLSLYTNATTLFNYNCSEHNSCHLISNDTVTIDSPYLQGKGVYAMVNASLDTADWNPSSDVIVNINRGNSSQNSSSTPYGYVGLGLAGSARNNFLGQPSLSISLSANGRDGKLLFSPDVSLDDPDDAEVTWSTDSNWHVNGVESIRIGSTINVNNTNLIFDLNSDAIGLPLPIFNQVIASLESDFGLMCSSDVYQPVCSNFNMKDPVPDLQINVGGQELSIPYNIYVQGDDPDEESYEMIFNLKALASNLTRDCYVTPDYENYIILNYRVLSNYYTVFDGSSQSISLYRISSNDSTSYILYIILGWFGFFIMVALGYYCYMRMKMARAAAQNLANVTQNEGQDPLIPSSVNNDETDPQVPNQQQQSFVNAQ